VAETRVVLACCSCSVLEEEEEEQEEVAASETCFEDSLTRSREEVYAVDALIAGEQQRVCCELENMGVRPSRPDSEGPEYGEEFMPDYNDDEVKYCMFKDDVAKIRYAQKGIAARPEEGGFPSHTLVQAFQLAAESSPDKPALRVERPLPEFSPETGAPAPLPTDQWKTWTWHEYYQESRAVAKAFLALGAVRYDGVMILGFNSPEWFMAQMGAMMMGAITAGVYPTDTKAQVAYKSQLADGAIAVVDSASNFEKFAGVVDELPELRAIITWGCEKEDVTRSDGSVVKVMTWEQLIAMGSKETNDEELDEIIDSIKPGNCALLVFTSGTTGMPKAVMISHDNMLFVVFSVVERNVPDFGLLPEQERLLSYLPLSHVAGMMVDIVVPLVATGYRPCWTTTHFARPYDLKQGSLGDRLRVVRPTFFLGVPRVYEKIAEKLKSIGAKTTGVRKSISNWAKAQAKYAQDHKLLGGDGATGLMYPVANKLLGKVHEALGLDIAKSILSGAAPLSIDTVEYFAQIGLNVNEVYGMSECTGVATWSTDDCHMWGSVGFQVEGTEVRVFEVSEDGSKRECPKAENFDRPTDEEQGELCLRGRNIMMGYLANPKLGEEHVEDIRAKNEAAIDNEGFLHSGDRGIKTTQNIYRITGRYKELIITAGGENISPVPIEDALKKVCPIVSNAVMIGDKRKFNVMLITLTTQGANGERPGTENLAGDAAKLDKQISTLPEAMKSDKFIKTITDALTVVNKDDRVVVSNASKIQKFTILPRDLSVETGEITPSLKLKRSVTQDNFHDIIELMYKSDQVYVSYNDLIHE